MTVIAATWEGFVNGSLPFHRLIGMVMEGPPTPAGDALERQAIADAKSGDAGAYDYLVRKYLKRVLSIAWGIVRNPADAEDLAQEAFLRGFERLDRFREQQPFGPWIYRIVTNLALDALRRRGRIQEAPVPPEQPGLRRDHADLPSETAQLRERIDQAIELLPDMQRVVARLYLVEEFGHAEIAAMCNLSEGTVRSHLSLARQKLKQQLADLYGDRDE